MGNNKILLIAEFGSFGGPLTNFKKLLTLYKSKNYMVKVVLNENQFTPEIRHFVEGLDFKYYIIQKMNLPVFLKSKIKHVVTNFINFFKLIPVYLKEQPNLIVVSTGNPGSLLNLIVLPTKFLYILRSYPVSGKKFSLKCIVLNIMLGKRKRILTVSKFSKNNIIKYWFLNSKKRYVQYIYNSSEEKSLEIKETKKREKNFILTIGHVRWYKNPELWLKVAKIVTDRFKNYKIEFIWVGDGELLKDFKKKVENSGKPNIKFIGFRNNIEDYLQKTIIYLQPSLVESHGLSVLDAMRHSIPCIVSNVGGLPESVINNKTGYVIDVNNPNKFAEKIILLLSNSSLRKKLGANGRRRYLKIFSYEKWSNYMIDLHEELLGS